MELSVNFSDFGQYASDIKQMLGKKYFSYTAARLLRELGETLVQRTRPRMQERHGSKYATPQNVVNAVRIMGVTARPSPFLADLVYGIDDSDANRGARHLEVGRMPGSKAPPRVAIEQWLVKKGRSIRMELGTSARRKNLNEVAMLKAVAWRIQMKIKERGIPAKRALMASYAMGGMGPAQFHAEDWKIIEETLNDLASYIVAKLTGKDI